MALQPVVETAPPLGVGAERYKGANLLDSFGVTLPPGTHENAHHLARLALVEPPFVFRAAITLRDRIMSVFKVHTSGEMRGMTDTPHIDFFPVLSISPDEVELGLDDRHLDFRAWMTVSDTDSGRLLRFTTYVRAHNLLGKAYLAAIGPFHVMVVRASLRRVVRRLRDPSWAFTPIA